MSWSTLGEESLLYPPLFDLLELVDNPCLLTQIPPLIESSSSDECLRNSPCPTSWDAQLHTFPDPPPLQQCLHGEANYTPEDHLPVWPLETFNNEASPLPQNYQPSDPQFCATWYPEEMETQDEAVPFVTEPINSEEISSPYFQPIYSTLPTSPRTPSPTTEGSTPSTPIDYSQWTLPLLFTPSPPTAPLDSPLSSLSSSSELGFDAALSPSTSTMDSEPEFYEGFEPEFITGNLQEDPSFSPDCTQPPFHEMSPAFLEYAQQAPACEAIPAYAIYPAHAAQDAQGYILTHDHLSPPMQNPLQGDIDASMYYPQFQLMPNCASPSPASPINEWIPVNPLYYTCENNNIGGNYDDQYYMADCETIAEIYSNLQPPANGQLAYENYYGFATSGNMECDNGYQYNVPYPHVNSTEDIPRADIREVLKELNAMRTSLRSIPERTKKNYAQFHNTLSKLATQGASNNRDGRLREDLSRMVGIPRLSAPAKPTATSKFPTRPPDATHARPHNPNHAPAYDRDTMAKLVNRKCKKNMEVDTKNTLDTFIEGSKVIRLTHSYQQLVLEKAKPTFKPEPSPKKRKTKKEVIEHIHKQIPEFSTLPAEGNSLPPPAPKPTHKKHNKEFWKTLENN